jgi:hypothetical protein
MEIMWLILFIILSVLGMCFFITLIIGLLRAARRADEGEERILAIISSVLPDDSTVLEGAAVAQAQTAPLPNI